MDSDYKNGTKFSRGFEQKGKSRGLLKVNKKVGFFFLLSFSKDEINQTHKSHYSKQINKLTICDKFEFSCFALPKQREDKIFWLFMAKSSRGVASEKAQTLLLNWVFSFVSTEREECRREEIFGVWKNRPMERDELSTCVLRPRESDDQTSNRGEKSSDLSLALSLSLSLSLSLYLALTTS
ncbi:hypothetical protein PanWU01x14_333810 [Parasponia andersonii]|uniref:Uncharacterized protein n=1 Tax=Parasponia andersonii TaxID=3476 RepID=A0A2P5AGT3_PARAD|nr:hypothetical protein PanWU01x14_333810 [Parasponia andersonii]